MTERWNQILTSLSAIVDPSDFKIWLTPLAAAISGRTISLTLKGGTAYMLRRCEEKIGPALREVASRHLGCAPGELVLRFASGAPEAPAAAAPAPRAGSGVLPAARTGAVPPAGARRAVPALLCHPPVQDAPLPAADVSALSATPRSIVPDLPLDQPTTASGARLLARQWRHSFDDFVVGPTNAMAATAAQDLCRDGGSVETLFLSSGPGLGKTHIVQSAVRRVLDDRGASARVAYLTADDFYSRFRMGIRTGSLDDFTQRVKALDFLLLDDVQYLHGKEKTQELLMSLVKHLQDRGSKVVIASRYLPKDLKVLDSQLVSLLSSGVLATMDAPTYDMRREIVRRKAGASGLRLTDEVAELVAGRLEGDVRRIQSCLQTMEMRTRLGGGAVTPELALEVLAQIAPAEDAPSVRASFEELQDLVLGYYGITAVQLRSAVRRQSYVEARNVLFYLARKYTGMTLVEIGARVNKRHSTVIKGIATVEQLLEKETPKGRQAAQVVGMVSRSRGARGAA